MAPAIFCVYKLYCHLQCLSISFSVEYVYNIAIIIGRFKNYWKCAFVKKTTSGRVCECCYRNIQILEQIRYLR